MARAKNKLSNPFFSSTVQDVLLKVHASYARFYIIVVVVVIVEDSTYIFWLIARLSEMISGLLCLYIAREIFRFSMTPAPPSFIASFSSLLSSPPSSSPLPSEKRTICIMHVWCMMCSSKIQIIKLIIILRHIKGTLALKSGNENVIVELYGLQASNLRVPADTAKPKSSFNGNQIYEEYYCFSCIRVQMRNKKAFY